ncbi:hypothetical protein [Dyadobacter frigoris]|uniref:Uncharacterized protein n=1 Tax=Dyadobacter frigoris TaxID=2576211 RepID=A0A4U6D5Y3_9BACT|nr:hypothetical protein [Dyadobacter frigoris]TKT92790.1 hypothetical protein FDK13_08275 [Dyadobacter frigoris]
MKFKSFLIWVAFPLLVLLAYWKITVSNRIGMKLTDCKDGSIEAIQELNKQLIRNFLNREFYQVSAFTDFGPCYLANYNKKYELLRVAIDPPSGWSGLYKATPQQLQEIVDRKLNDDQIRQYLEAFPNGNYPEDLD